MNLEITRIENGLMRTDTHKDFHDLPDPARNVRSRSPVRVKGLLASAKNGGLVAVDSHLEFQEAMLLETMPAVVGYAAQPKTFEFIIDGKRRRYTPDFLVKYANGTSEYIEVKTSKHAEEPSFKAVEAEMARVCVEDGVGFRTVLEHDIRKQPRLDNADHLLSTKMCDLSKEQRLSIMLFFERKPRASAKDVSALLGDPPHLALKKLLHLAMWGHLRVDLDTKFTIYSPFWLPKEERLP